MFALRYQGKTLGFILALFRIHYLVLSCLSYPMSCMYTVTAINNSKDFNALISKVWLLHTFTYLITWGLTTRIPFLIVSTACNCQDLGRRVYGYYQENW